jgi:hypothetical protein
MTTDYVGEIQMEINGAEVDIVSFDDTFTSGKKPVPTMNKTRRPKGSTRGSEKVEWKITAPAQLVGGYKWRSMNNARIVTYPVETPSARTTYFDSNVTSVGKKYSLDNEMVQDISGYSLRVDEPA